MIVINDVEEGGRGLIKVIYYPHICLAYRKKLKLLHKYSVL
jgi:hypothetical protein